MRLFGDAGSVLVVGGGARRRSARGIEVGARCRGGGVVVAAVAAMALEHEAHQPLIDLGLE